MSRSIENDRQVITILELDVSLGEWAAMRASLTRPDAAERLSEETTELAGLFEEVLDTRSI